MVRVVAALFIKNNSFFICQRPRSKARGLLWEFPGGKVEPGETPEQALIRECREELDADIEPGPVYATLVHEYPDLTIELMLFRAKFKNNSIPRLIEHEDCRYVSPDDINLYSFCSADYPVLEMLKKDFESGKFNEEQL